MTNLTLGISYDIRDAKKAQNYSDPNPTLILDKRGNHKKIKKVVIYTHIMTIFGNLQKIKIKYLIIKLC